MNKRLGSWLAIVLVFTLIFPILAACSDAGNFVKDNYSLVDVQGQGKNTAKVYSVEGKDVPTVSNEIAANEKPKEMSKESLDQMFLVYNSRIINVQKDPDKENNTLVEIDSIEYAKENYDSSFLQGYVAASVLQSLLGSSWLNGNRSGSDYKGYRTTPRYDDYGKYQQPAAKTKEPAKSTPAPTTTDRKGSFGTTPAPSAPAPSSNGSSKPSAPESGKPATPSVSDSKGSFTSPSSTTKPSSSTTTKPSTSPKSSSSSSNIRKNDGSTSTSKPSSSSKPSTSTRSGSFKK
ncbi:protein of unknown function [Paenibacillus sp. 1_12]|uniref:DUF4247 domain-containing protein n=1 Tax=Paenibacillus sp. 1_12 TaxID=1566278 RepID=UPI0008ECFF19|nr:DUF4247 domain-containing protein [Paenibacillus sp. 1_12]SFL27094.1 protein of unknown function [Paenibacillus sp. 1_12]